MADPRVPLIRARFGLGSLADSEERAASMTRASPRAVAAFQKTRGLAGDGALNSATSEALFGDPEREPRAPRSSPTWRCGAGSRATWARERIEINVPDFTLRVMDGDDEVHRARVIVGKPDTPTPIFSNEVKYHPRQSDLAGARLHHQEGDDAEARRAIPTI